MWDSIMRVSFIIEFTFETLLLSAMVCWGRDSQKSACSTMHYAKYSVVSTFEKFHLGGTRYRFSKVRSLLNLLYELTVNLTFENLFLGAIVCWGGCSQEFARSTIYYFKYSVVSTFKNFYLGRMARWGKDSQKSARSLNHYVNSL